MFYAADDEATKRVGNYWLLEISHFKYFSHHIHGI